MRAEITHKVPNGKLLRISIEFDTTIIQQIKICGDFFAYPEDVIARFENALTHLPIESNSEKIKHVLDGIVLEQNAQLVGFDTEVLSQIIGEAINP